MSFHIRSMFNSALHAVRSAALPATVAAPSLVPQQLPARPIALPVSAGAPTLARFAARFGAADQVAPRPMAPPLPPRPQQRDAIAGQVQALYPPHLRHLVMTAAARPLGGDAPPPPPRPLSASARSVPPQPLPMPPARGSRPLPELPVRLARSGAIRQAQGAAPAASPAAVAADRLAKAYFARYPGGLLSALDAAPVETAQHDVRAATQLAMHNGSQAFLAWMKENGLQGVSTSGAGNRCLISSLLQHASGAYEASSDGRFQEQVEGLHQEMMTKFSHMKPNQKLALDAPETGYLLELLAKRYPPALEPIEVRVDAQGAPQLYGRGGVPVGDFGEVHGKRPAPVWLSSEHFQPIVAVR